LVEVLQPFVPVDLTVLVDVIEGEEVPEVVAERRQNVAFHGPVGSFLNGICAYGKSSNT
jgi:hypothetical protein